MTLQNLIIRYQLNGLILLELGYPKTTPEIVSETTAEFLFGPPNRQGKYLFVYIYQLSYKCTYWVFVNDIRPKLLGIIKTNIANEILMCDILFFNTMAI